MLSLALGIGANAATFSALKALLITPLPYPQADRLVAISAESLRPPIRRGPPTVPEYFVWNAHTELFDGVTALSRGRTLLDVTGSNEPAEWLVVQASTASVFRVLRVDPLLGRPFTEADDAADAPVRVALISERLWHRRFGGAPDVLTRVIRLDGTTTHIVGVMPDESSPLSDDVDIWRPMHWDAILRQGSARGFPVAARLRPGVTLEQTRTVMAQVVTSITAEAGGSEPWRAVVTPLRRAMYGSYAGLLALLQGIAGVVLLIACANVAGLLLARSAARRTEMAIRMSMGAGRRRLVRQLLTESALLAACGGLAAIGVARLGLWLLIATSPTAPPRSTHMVLDGGVLAFMTVISALAALVFGTLPALQAARADPIDSLKPSASRRGPTRVAARPRRSRHRPDRARHGAARRLRTARQDAASGGQQ